jgi:transcriptional regulator with XRE-family HTH domain
MPQKERCNLHTGTKIKELRKAKNLTQEELGELLGVKKAAIQKYEKGEIVNLKLSTIKKPCEIFEITPATIIFPEADEMDRIYNSNKLHFEVKVIEEIEAIFGLKAIEMMETFTKLNEEGKDKALDMIDDISLIDKYIKVQD